MTLAADAADVVVAFAHLGERFVAGGNDQVAADHRIGLAGGARSRQRRVLQQQQTDLIAGGGFTMAGGSLVDNIARWDGTSWSALGSGMAGGASNNNVNALGLLPTGDVVAVVGVPQYPHVRQGSSREPIAPECAEWLLRSVAGP